MLGDQAPPTRVQWFVASGLGVVANISGIAATFMPMKSVFILASDEIPSFFPKMLIEPGPIFTALVLIGLAGLSGAINQFSKDWGQKLSSPKEVMPGSPGDHRDGLLFKFQTKSTLRDFTTMVTATILVIGAAIISPPFLGIVLLWVGLSSGVLAFLVHKRDRRPPFTSGIAEFSAEFSALMNKSSLWSTVGGAVITLLVNPPAWGLTGILLSAVILQRLQKLIGPVGHLLLPRGIGSENLVAEASVGARPNAPIPAPLDFIASKTGQRLFVRSLKELSLSTTDWQPIGVSNRNQASLLAREIGSGKSVMLRLFASDRAELRDNELEFRNVDATWTPFLHSSAEPKTIAGLPGILVKFSDQFRPDASLIASQDEAVTWQLNWELRCIRDRALQELLSNQSCQRPRDSILPGLVLMSKLRGPHQDAAKQLQQEVLEREDNYMESPRVFSIGRPVGPTNLLRSPQDLSEPIDCSMRAVVPFGASWGTSPLFRTVLSSRLGPDSPSEEIVTLASSNARLEVLRRRVDRRDYRALQSA